MSGLLKGPVLAMIRRKSIFYRCVKAYMAAYERPRNDERARSGQLPNRHPYGTEYGYKYCKDYGTAREVTYSIVKNNFGAIRKNYIPACSGMQHVFWGTYSYAWQSNVLFPYR